VTQRERLTISAQPMNPVNYGTKMVVAKRGTENHMKLSTQWIGNDKYEMPVSQPSRRSTFLSFLMRYPIFLLAFGPPLFRSTAGVDATKGQLDAWSFLQVGLLSLVAIRAIWRLASAESIHIPKQIRSIFKLSFLLGFLFLASAVYSTSHPVSAAYSILYFLTMICVVDFVIDVYQDPPDWMQCLLQLRLVMLLLFGLVLVTLAIDSSLVLAIEPGAGIRLGGGAVASVAIICPMIAVISAYTFLHSLESRVRSFCFFLMGLTGTLSTQSRGSEIALFLSLAILGAGWAKTEKRTAYTFISVLMASILLFGAVVGTVGGERMWNFFNRGESVEGIESASGRTDIWKFVIQYCMAHPQGMGYIAGFRTLFKEYFALGLQVDVTHIGSSHNAFIDILADAGWLALALYLVMMAKIVSLGWHFAKKTTLEALAQEDKGRCAIRCALVLLIFCFAEGIDDSQFSIPLRSAFYLQNIIVALILSISARMLVASRIRNIPWAG